MPKGDEIFTDWQKQVAPRIQHIRNAYYAAGTLEELKRDAEQVRDSWVTKMKHPDVRLAQEAADKHLAANAAYEEYARAYEAVGSQMQLVRLELNKLQDQRLTLSGMCRALNVQELGADVLERVYGAIGPDSPVESALATARTAVSELSAEAAARQELQAFLADSSPA
ncbi:MAG TPA: hypothetical protein VLA04_04985 [Verrucomicrobiae bacterium]|nr:hypothetical protein [Verrucomicrobiae bacterium]